MKIEELLVEQEISVNPLFGFCSNRDMKLCASIVGKEAKCLMACASIAGDRNNREDFEHKMQAEKFDAAIDMICFKPRMLHPVFARFVGWDGLCKLLQFALMASNMIIFPRRNSPFTPHHGVWTQ